MLLASCFCRKLRRKVHSLGGKWCSTPCNIKLERAQRPDRHQFAAAMATHRHKHADAQAEAETEPQAERVANGEGSSYANNGDGDAGSQTPEFELHSLKPLVRADSLDVEAGKIKGWSPHERTLSTAVILRLAYQSVGVIYGDVGTSPLYVYSTAFPYKLEDDPHYKDNLLGVLSLIVYTLTLSPLLKYVCIVLMANDNGEGGTFALYSTLCRFAKVGLIPSHNQEDRELSTYQLQLPSRRKNISNWLKHRLESSVIIKNLLLILVLLGTSLIIGDGTLTPSISVLSAISGLSVNPETQVSKGVVVGVTCVILILLFALQHKGTDKVGFLFAPAVCTWFVCIALIGIYNIFKHDPSIFKALNPQYIYLFFQRNKKDGWVHLGGVVLAITGTEAMFADLGHFSVPSVRIAFTCLVYPSLLLAYIGQAAYLMKHPEEVSETFYKSIPKPVYWPMFAVATAAAIIASQAMISAVFSIVKQSMAVNCFPRVKVIHTSVRFPGQIYIPELNWLLMILCLLITLGFQDTVKIGNAYGIAVVGVFNITTILMTIIMLMIWQVHFALVLLFLLVFGTLDGVYLSAVLYKVPQGGWVPLVFACVFLSVMYVWQYVQVHKYRYEAQNKVSLDWVVGLGSNLGMTRVPGIALVYSELSQGVPPIFSHLITNLPAIHSTVIFVCIKHLPLPFVPEDERFLVRRLGPKEYRMYRCAVRYGYKDVDEYNHEDFESHLVQTLSDFLQVESAMEAADAVNASGDYKLNNADPTLSGRSSSDDSTGTGLVVKAVNGGNEKASTGPSLGEELLYLQQAKRAGVVYLLGTVDLRAKPGSNFFRKIIVDGVFAFLRRNSRDTKEALHVPYTSLLQVGMVNEI